MMNKIPFQCFESFCELGKHILRETYFVTTAEGQLIRRNVYRAGGECVVAFQDEGHGIDHDLYVETMFYELNKTEDAWLQIQADAGVYALNHIHLFDMR